MRTRSNRTATRRWWRNSFKANFVPGVALIDEGKWSDDARISLEYAQVRYPEAKTLLSKWPPKATANE